MGRAKKNALNQSSTHKPVVEEPKIEVKEEIKEEAPLFEVKNSQGDTVFAVHDEIPEIEEPVEEVKMEIPTESPSYEDDGEEDGDVGEEPVERTLADLSHKELQFFKRTGIMPK